MTSHAKPEIGTPAITPADIPYGHGIPALSARRTVRKSAIAMVCGWLKIIPLAYDVHRERVALSNLSDAHLRDIGVAPADARHEIRKGPWNLPRERIHQQLL